MGYSDLIDKLLDTRIHEGMLSAMGDKGVSSLVKALESGDAKYLKGSNVKVDAEYYFNNSPFSKDLLSYVVDGEDYLATGVRILKYIIYPIVVMIIYWSVSMLI